jgi:outer membrane protein assembly factor BamB
MMVTRKKLRITLLLKLSSVLFLFTMPGTSPAAAQSGSDWPQLAGGPAHTNFSSDPTFATLPQSEGELQLKWKFALNERIEITAQPIVANGRVYLGLMDGRVLALDATNGTPLWTKTVGGAVPNTLAYADERVYFGAENGIVYALNAANGDEIWRYSTGGAVYSSAAVVGDTVYVGSTDAYLYALNAGDGALQWRFQAAGPVLTSPAVGGGQIYFGAEDAAADPATPYPIAYAVDTSGGLIWSRALTGLSLRHTYPVLDQASDTVIFRTIHPGWSNYGPLNDWPFQHPCVSQEAETPANLIAGWNNYYQTYPERRAWFFLNASNGQDKPNFPTLPPPPYWGVILPLVDDQHRAWFPTVGACNEALEHDWRLWRMDLFTRQVEQVATQSQFTLRPDEVGRPTLAGDGSNYRYYNAIDADLGVYASGVSQWYLFGRDGFYNHNYPLDFPPTLHFLRYAGAWLAGNVPSASQPVIANGVIYFTTFGWLYAVEAGSGGHGTPQPPPLTPPNPANPPVPESMPSIRPDLGDGSPKAIRVALNAQVAELIAHGPPTPSAVVSSTVNPACR